MKTKSLIIILIIILILSFTSIKTFANSKIWLSTSFNMEIDEASLTKWRLEQSASIPIFPFLSLSAVLGYSYYYDNATGYKIMLGGTYIFPKSWYIDLLYGIYFFGEISQHEIFLSVNFEKDEWFLAFRQVLKFGQDFFATISYIYSIYNFPNGYTFSVNSAVAYDTENGISYALWVKSYLALFSIFGLDVGVSIAVEKNLFNFSTLFGIKFNFPIFSISTYWQPFFLSKAGISEIGFALVLKL